MAKMTKAARTLQQLDDEIEALKEKARRLEDELDDSWNYFQEHSGQLFRRLIANDRNQGAGYIARERAVPKAGGALGREGRKLVGGRA
jgi:FtsZ-binding cell division protein ZapB